MLVGSGYTADTYILNRAGENADEIPWSRRACIKQSSDLRQQNAEMTAIPPTTEPATPSAAAERMRRHRQRRRDGLRCFMIELRETEIDALIERDY